MTIHPPDAAVAARSFPRRWEALFARAAGDDDEPDVLARSGAPELAGQAADALEEATTRLGGLGHGAGPAPLDRLGTASLRLAETVDAVAPDDWSDERVDALTAGIEEAAALLRRAERAIEEARGDRGD